MNVLSGLDTTGLGGLDMDGLGGLDRDGLGNMDDLDMDGLLKYFQWPASAASAW